MQTTPTNCDFAATGGDHWAILPPLIAVGLDSDLMRICRNSFRLTEADANSLVPCLLAEQAAVVVFGPALSVDECIGILNRIAAEAPGTNTASVVLCAGRRLEQFGDLVAEDRVFYLTRGRVSERELSFILQAAANSLSPRATEDLARDDHSDERLLEFTSLLARQADLSDAAGVLTEAIKDLLECDAVRCLLYDPSFQCLHTPGPRGARTGMETAAAGLIGYVARTGDRVDLERIGRDPRYEAEGDNPGGEEDARFVAEPVPGIGNHITAVLTATRKGRARPFSVEDCRRLRKLAGVASAVLLSIATRNDVERQMLEHTHAAGSSADAFLAEALEQNTRGWEHGGDVLRTNPRWLQWSHWFTAGLLVATLVFFSLARIHHYAGGQMVIRARGRIVVATAYAGLVRSVAVGVGDRVRKGDLLIEFHDPPGITAPVRFRSEVRAPGDGLVSDLRVRPGERLNAGDQAASIIDESAGYELIALLPGHFAPQMHIGMPMAVKPDGYPDSYELIPIRQISAEVFGSRDAARYAGVDGGETPAAAPVVIVRAIPTNGSFISDGHVYSYRDGMTGRAEVSLGSEPILISLIPGLKAFLQRR